MEVCFRYAVKETHNVLDNFATLFPDWAGQGYEIAGFAWFQGHEDTGNDVHADRYELNLVNLIQTFRSEFGVPEAPFVIATIGFDGWEMSGNTLKVANAQLAASGETGNYSEFEGNVLTVETRDFWREASLSPKDQGYHYNQNAENIHARRARTGKRSGRVASNYMQATGAPRGQVRGIIHRLRGCGWLFVADGSQCEIDNGTENLILSNIGSMHGGD